MNNFKWLSKFNDLEALEDIDVVTGSWNMQKEHFQALTKWANKIGLFFAQNCRAS